MPQPAPSERRPSSRSAGGKARSGEATIDGYVLGEKIGEGAMAVVYRARHKVLDKEVAVKVLAPEFSSNPEYVARFLREARAAARISHPNVVQIHDAGESRGRHFIAMELVEGQTLHKLVARDGPLSEIAALKAALGVARALEAAAAERIVHRDVKPENIVRTPDGRIKLLDLGLARRQHHRGEDGFITDHGKTLGTPYFVSPEQARGEELDTRSDIYSLGVTLFYLVTGEVPFKGATAPEVMRRHIQDPVPSVRVLRPGLTPAFDALVAKMLAKDPKRRYPTPRELGEALEVVLSGEEGEEGGDGDEAGDDDEDEGGGEERTRGKGRRRAAPRRPPPARAAVASAAARVRGETGPRPSRVQRLATACAMLGGVLVLLIAIKWSMGPLEANDGAGGRGGRARAGASEERSSAHEEARGAADSDFRITLRNAREMASGGDPQGALALWSRMYPREKRAGELAAKIAWEEEEIRKAVAKRFEDDLARAEEERKGGFFKKARIILQRVRKYGGAVEIARAEQELAKLEAEEKAARAGDAAAGVGARERAELGKLVAEIGPLVREGRYDEAAERAAALGRSIGASVPCVGADLATEAGKLLRELNLLDQAAREAIAAVPPDAEEEFTMASGTRVAGRVAGIDEGGRVTVEGSSGRVSFTLGDLSIEEKERLGQLARGARETERFMVILLLYAGRPEALERARALGSPALLDHVVAIRDIIVEAGAAGAPPVAPPAAGSDGVPAPPGPAPEEVASGAAEPPAGQPTAQPEPPAPAPPKPPRPPADPPAASKLAQVLARLLAAPVACDGDRSFTARYAWAEGGATQESVKDWSFPKPPFKRGFTVRGFALDCRQPAKLGFKIPLAQPFEVELEAHVESKGQQAGLVLVFGEKGGTDLALECGQALGRRTRGQVVQALRKSAKPPSDHLRAGGDVRIRLRVENDEASAWLDGKPTFERARVPGADGDLSIEIADLTLTISSLVIRAAPDALWFAQEVKKLE